MNEEFLITKVLSWLGKIELLSNCGFSRKIIAKRKIKLRIIANKMKTSSDFEKFIKCSRRAEKLTVVPLYYRI